ncbi:MAG: response regulator [Bacteriovoracaceae bacterium]
MKILVVDDMAVMRKIIKKVLVSLGYENLVEADDGVPAWELLNEHHNKGEPFEFVVSDWNMPNMTGLDLLKKVRADEKFKSLPFLMVTAEGEKSNVVIAVKAGVSNFIVKPFNAETFKAKMDAVLQKVA